MPVDISVLCSEGKTQHSLSPVPHPLLPLISPPEVLEFLPNWKPQQRPRQPLPQKLQSLEPILAAPAEAQQMP